MLSTVLCNPYHRCGAVVARLAVNGATLLWSIVVLIKEDALSIVSYGPMLTRYAPENVYALFFGALSAFMLWRLIRKSKPHPIGIVGYAILLLAWGFVECVLLFVQRPIQPTATATVTVIFLLALFGFVASPKVRPDAPA